MAAPRLHAGMRTEEEQEETRERVEGLLLKASSLLEVGLIEANTRGLEVLESLETSITDGREGYLLNDTDKRNVQSRILYFIMAAHAANLLGHAESTVPKTMKTPGLLGVEGRADYSKELFAKFQDAYWRWAQDLNKQQPLYTSFFLTIS